MLCKANKIEINLKRAGLAIRYLVFIGVCAVYSVSCSSSQHKDDESDVAAPVKIDCEQEANKYRKPCRGNRW